MSLLTLRAALEREQKQQEQLPGSIASAVDVLIAMIDAVERRPAESA